MYVLGVRSNNMTINCLFFNILLKFQNKINIGILNLKVISPYLHETKFLYHPKYINEH